MGFLEVSLLSVSSLTLGAIGVGVFWLKETLTRWDSRIETMHAEVEAFQKHIALTAEGNNALIRDLVDIKDRVSTHELMLKGIKR